jgi:hypothetical protein|tara:strand:+ start:6445 stop:8010 length:1566 start_codon:yes stop_codon:yes gene_type:complete
MRRLDQGGFMSDAGKFAGIFDGLRQAYGTYNVKRKNANGKNLGKASLVREPRTTALWENHLSGEGVSIGIIPINETNECRWGCLDIDEYPLDHKVLVEKIRKAKLPLVVCRSKSGGAHCFLFCTEWIAAKEMQEVLQSLSAGLGYGTCEVFPKQIQLNLDRGDVGNFLNIPYYDASDGLRYAIHDDGSAATLSEFFELHEKHVQTPEQLLALTIEATDGTPVPDGPPCLQHLCSQKISEGSRNNGLFNIGVFLRKAFPDAWETEILNYNANYLVPPLPLSEVNVVAKQLQKKDYTYKCKDSPINAFCNADLCRTRKHGVDATATGTLIANLRKYNSQPPVWFVDVNGQPLEMDTEGLMNQPAFQRSCVEQLNFMPRTQTKEVWEGRLNHLLMDMTQTEGNVREVSQDASIAGQFYDFLEEWCTSKQRASEREEILLRRPYTDEEDGVTYFRLKDFDAFLRKNRFFDFKPHKMAQRLRDINGKSILLKVSGKPIRVWSIPAHEQHAVEVPAPDFGENKDSPF